MAVHEYEIQSTVPHLKLQDLDFRIEFVTFAANVQMSVAKQVLESIIRGNRLVGVMHYHWALRARRSSRGSRHETNQKRTCRSKDLGLEVRWASTIYEKLSIQTDHVVPIPISEARTCELRVTHIASTLTTHPFWIPASAARPVTLLATRQGPWGS